MDVSSGNMRMFNYRLLYIRQVINIGSEFVMRKTGLLVRRDCGCPSRGPPEDTESIVQIESCCEC